MGTHSSGPAKVYGSDLLLSDWIKSNPTSVGLVPLGYSTDDLPFLFKVLSVNTALSIQVNLICRTCVIVLIVIKSQAHPNKKLAVELHANHPSIYKDANHKPEMAIALTEFECMCGFRSPDEIEANLNIVPELRVLIGQTSSSSLLSDATDHLRGLFAAYMSCAEDIANVQINALVARLTEKAKDSLQSPLSSLELLMLRLNGEYPNDRGVFAPCLLNVLTLLPGESFFIGADEPHAYLRGDCVECMALSDNVVRAGLTPKFKDVDTLCNMLHYRYGPPEMLKPLSIDQFTVVYR
jgi:mannose-6-phosphate isomerase